jgi:hypothetical protein
MERIRVPLHPEVFGGKECSLIEIGSLSATAFRFESGVAAVRLRNDKGSLVMLPFQGQQIWAMSFGGRELAMRSMFTQPVPTRSYLETYGAMLIHCGATAMGVPSGADTHPLHGELPNAPYRSAWLELGEDALGPFISLSGEYEHTVAFSAHYLARPLVKLHAGATLVQASMTIENLKRTPMELMYLAHANFRPVDHGRLEYTARCTPETVRVRTSIPSHVRTSAEYPAFLAELAAHPERHNVLTPGLAFDPEVVFFIDYLADADGWAHTMQVHPDGSADLISHRTDQLDHGVRWICRTPDQDALGMCLPATAEPEGYHAELAKGNVRTLPAGGVVRFDMVFGYVSPAEVPARREEIRRILGAAS